MPGVCWRLSPMPLWQLFSSGAETYNFKYQGVAYTPSVLNQQVHMLPMPTVFSTRLYLGAVACPGFFYQEHIYREFII